MKADWRQQHIHDITSTCTELKPGLIRRDVEPVTVSNIANAAIIEEKHDATP
jgi:hypothetical protein